MAVRNSGICTTFNNEAKLGSQQQSRNFRIGHMDLVRTLQTLPTDKQAELADFVQFLALKFASSDPGNAAGDDWTERELSQLALQQATRGLEADAAIYTLADLRERWQRNWLGKSS